MTLFLLGDRISVKNRQRDLIKTLLRKSQPLQGNSIIEKPQAIQNIPITNFHQRRQQFFLFEFLFFFFLSPFPIFYRRTIPPSLMVKYLSLSALGYIMYFHRTGGPFSRSELLAGMYSKKPKEITFFQYLVELSSIVAPSPSQPLPLSLSLFLSLTLSLSSFSLSISLYYAPMAPGWGPDPKWWAAFGGGGVQPLKYIRVGTY